MYMDLPVLRALEARNELGIGQYDSIDIFKILRDRENISITDDYVFNYLNWDWGLADFILA